MTCLTMEESRDSPGLGTLTGEPGPGTLDQMRRKGGAAKLIRAFVSADGVSVCV